jgi:UDP-glucose:(heptosyl)LPS alpha-1,3-glucosyltransferase
VSDLGLVVPRFGPAGGNEAQAWRLANALVERGHEVTVYAGAFDARADARIRRVALGPWARGGGARALAFALASRRVGDHDAVWSFGRSLRHDIVRMGWGAHGAWVERRPGLTSGRSTPKDWLFMGLDAQAARRARVVVVNSAMAKADVVRHCGVPGDKVLVIRNGVDLGRFSPEPRREALRRRLGLGTGRIAVFVGSGFVRKGLGTAAQAFLTASAPQDELVVIGRDRHEGRWRARLEGELCSKLRWVGPCEDPAPWIRAADALVLPTTYDPASNVVLEAMASGIPAVTSRWDGSAEVVPDRRLIVDDPLNQRDVAAALDYAWSSPSLGGLVRAAALVWPDSRYVDEWIGQLPR